MKAPENVMAFPTANQFEQGTPWLSSPVMDHGRLSMRGTART